MVRQHKGYLSLLFFSGEFNPFRGPGCDLNRNGTVAGEPNQSRIDLDGEHHS